MTTLIYNTITQQVKISNCNSKIECLSLFTQPPKQFAFSKTHQVFSYTDLNAQISDLRQPTLAEQTRLKTWQGGHLQKVIHTLKKQLNSVLWLQKSAVKLLKRALQLFNLDVIACIQELENIPIDLRLATTIDPKLRNLLAHPEKLNIYGLFQLKFSTSLCQQQHIFEDCSAFTKLYKMGELLGRGEDGEVHYATLRSSIQTPTLPQQMVVKSTTEQAGFLREIETMLYLTTQQKVQYIPTIFVIFVCQKKFSIGMQALKIIIGKALTSGQLTPQQYTDIFVQAIKNLQKAKVNDIDLHRGNIMLDFKNQPKIIDFGRSWVVESPNYPANFLSWYAGKVRNIRATALMTILTQKDPYFLMKSNGLASVNRALHDNQVDQSIITKIIHKATNDVGLDWKLHLQLQQAERS